MLSVLSNAAITGCQPMSGNLLWGSVACILLCKGQHSIVQIVQIEHTWEFSDLMSAENSLHSEAGGHPLNNSIQRSGLEAPTTAGTFWATSQLSSALCHFVWNCCSLLSLLTCCAAHTKFTSPSYPVTAQRKAVNCNWEIIPESGMRTERETCNSLDQERRGAEGSSYDRNFGNLTYMGN